MRAEKTPALRVPAVAFVKEFIKLLQIFGVKNRLELRVIAIVSSEVGLKRPWTG